MSSTSFTVVSSQFSIYAGLPIFSFGTIGNLINIYLLFSTRSISCSFLLVISSFFNLIALSTGLFPRVLSLGFGIDASSTSMVWYKSRLFISYNGTLTSLICICFAAIDRFSMSSRSKLSTAKITVHIAILIIIAINIPYLLFYTIIQVNIATSNTTTQCSPTDFDFVLYGNYFLRSFLAGLLTYRNITSIAGVQRRGTF